MRARTTQLEPPVGTRLRHYFAAIAGRLRHGRDRLGGGGDRAAAAQVLAGERARVAPELARAAEKHDLSAALAGSRAHIEDAVGLQHDLRVVLHDEQRIARIAQPFHHGDDPPHIARMQPDRGLVQHEQRVDERGPESGSEIDPLHFPARERARLAIECQIAQTHIHEKPAAGADLSQQQVGGFIEGLRQCQLAEELAGALERQQHHVVNRQTRERPQRLVGPLHAVRAEPTRRAERVVAELTAAQAPQEGGSLQSRAIAGGAGRIGAITRQQYANVHPVCPGLEPGKEASDPVPHAFAPRAFPFDDPLAPLRTQLAPRRVERDAALFRELLQILLALGVGLRLPRLDGAAAQRLALIGNDEAVVDADGAAKAAAGLAGADRRVEREQARVRLLIREVAMGAVQLARVAPRLEGARRVAVIDNMQVDSAATDAQPRLERFEHTTALGTARSQAILHHLEHDRRRGRRLTLALPRGYGGVLAVRCRIRLEEACVSLFR